MKDRIDLLKLYPNNAVIVEIGVASGCFTKQILATCPTLLKLICIDLWASQGAEYEDACNLSDEKQLERYNQFLADMKDEPRVTAIKEWSHVASGMFLDRTVDAIYLDANHSYEAVKQDLEAWYPKLKSGGIFSGHDYYEGNDVGHGVKKAVDEFCAKHGLTVSVTENEYCRPEGVYGASWEGYSFLFRKP
jgi:predicted O-methyltransferase YrrM